MRLRYTFYLLGFSILLFGIITYVFQRSATTAFTTSDSTFKREYMELDSLLNWNSPLVENNIKHVLNSAIKQQDTLALTHAYYYKSVVLRKKNELDSLPEVFNKTNLFLKSISDDLLKAKLNYEKGIYYSRGEHRDFIKSIEYLTAAQTYFEQQNQQNLLAYTYNALGTIHYQLNDKNAASLLLNKAYTLFKTTNDSLGIAVFLANKSKMNLDAISPSLAKEELLLAFDTFERFNDDLNAIKTLLFLADLELQSQNTSMALEYLGKSYKKALDIDNIPLQAHIVLHYGNVYIDTQEYEKAISSYQQGHHLLGNSNIDLLILKQLSDAYIKTNNFKKGYVYLNEFHKLKDSLKSKEVKSEVEEILWDNKLKKEQYEKQLLQNKIEIDTHKNNNLKSIYMIFSLLSLSSIVFIYLLYKGKIKSIKLVEVEKDRLAEKIKAEAYLKTLQKHHFEQELETKNRELTTIGIQLVSKGVFLKEIENIITSNNKHEDSSKMIISLKDTIRKINNQDKDWELFKNVFQNIHPTFFNTLAARYPLLSKTEVRICAYIRINMSNHEIATVLNIGNRSLITIRSRIRKKLNLDTADVLDDFIQSL